MEEDNKTIYIYNKNGRVNPELENDLKEIDDMITDIVKKVAELNEKGYDRCHLERYVITEFEYLAILECNLHNNKS